MFIPLWGLALIAILCVMLGSSIGMIGLALCKVASIDKVEIKPVAAANDEAKADRVA